MAQTDLSSILQRTLLHEDPEGEASRSTEIRTVWETDPSRLARILTTSVETLRTRNLLPPEELDWALLELIEQLVRNLLRREGMDYATLRKRLDDLMAQLPGDLRQSADRLGYKQGIDVLLAQAPLFLKVEIIAAEILHGKLSPQAVKDSVVKLCLSKDEKNTLVDRLRPRLGSAAASQRGAQILDLIRMALLVRPVATHITRTPKRKLRVLAAGAPGESFEVMETVAQREGHEVHGALLSQVAARLPQVAPQIVLLDIAALDAEAERIVADLAGRQPPVPFIACLPTGTALPWGRVGTSSAFQGVVKPINRKQLQLAIRAMASLAG